MTKIILILLVLLVSVPFVRGDGAGWNYYTTSVPASDSNLEYRAREIRDAASEEAKSTRRFILVIGIILFLTQIFSSAIVNRKSRIRLFKVRDRLTLRLSDLSGFLTKKLE